MTAAAFAPSSEVLARSVGSDVVLMDLGSEKYFSLNETGTVVWQSLVDGLTTDEIVAKIVSEYEIERDEVVGDVTTLLDQLLEAGLIIPKDG